MSQRFGAVGKQRVHAALYEEPHWYACHTRSRHEKRVAEQLVQRGLESYLPILVKQRQWSDRTRSIAFPLFPGYVFGRFSLAALHEVLSIPGLAAVIRHGGVPAPISEPEVENIRRCAAGLNETGQAPEPQPLSSGQWVRVVGGPFDGVEGVVVEQRGRRRVLVGLKTIGQGMEVDIDCGMLQPFRLAS